MYILVYTLMYFVCMHRTLCLLFHRILTVSRRIVMMFPWKTVGMHVPSCSSSAVCVLRMEGSQRTVYTKLVQVHTSMYMYVLVYTLMYFVYMHRTLWVLSHRILTVSRRRVMMSPWKTVGMLVPSCSSSAICVLRMEGSQRTVHWSRYILVCTCMYWYIH